MSEDYVFESSNSVARLSRLFGERYARYLQHDVWTAA